MGENLGDWEKICVAKFEHRCVFEDEAVAEPLINVSVMINGFKKITLSPAFFKGLEVKPDNWQEGSFEAIICVCITSVDLGEVEDYEECERVGALQFRAHIIYEHEPGVLRTCFIVASPMLDHPRFVSYRPCDIANYFADNGKLTREHSDLVFGIDRHIFSMIQGGGTLKPWKE